MAIEIDQSNKIEKTNKDTITGLANEKRFTIIIKAKTKRKLQEEFRKQGKPRLFVYRTFIAGVILLIKYAQLKNVSEIIIDKEYSGKEKLLKSMFLEMWTRFYENIPEIYFETIGRKSKAHIISYNTMKGKNKPNKIISFDEIKKLTLK